ncbi:DUF2089 family protein [Spirochaetota bacterium]
MKVVHCPNCSKRMTIRQLHCPTCDISISGSFTSDRFALLGEDMLDFIETFILARGNITEIEKQLGISYPTVKSRIDKMVIELESVKEKEKQMIKASKKEAEEKQRREKKLKEIYNKK